MKIALLLYPMNDLGGIINHTEDLAWGFKELGHQVDLYFLYWKKSIKETTITDEIVLDALVKQGLWSKGAFGIVSQQYGWNLSKEQKLCYLGEENTKRTIGKLQQYDLLIWETSAPSISGENKGNHDWLKLYSSGVPNIGFIHDGNFRDGYPWLYAVMNQFHGLACVHDCAYNSAENIAIPRTLILNPQDITKHNSGWDYKQRWKGFLSLQTFKKWKHVDDLVRAIPYIKGSSNKYLAGGGIEYRYMTSKDKIKEEYIARALEDPNLPPEIARQRISIWDRALEHGMVWLGYINNSDRNDRLKKLRVLVDPSWGNKYAAIGGHYNRTVVDAMLNDTIPVATSLGMLGTKNISNVFKPDINFIPLKPNMFPKQYAQVIEHACNLSNKERNKIIESNKSLLKLFDRKLIAQQVIDLSRGKPTGVLGKIEKGITSAKIKSESNKAMVEFFGEGINLKNKWRK